MNFTTEQDARIVINDLLKDSGWDLKDSFQVRTEVPVTLVKENQDKYADRDYSVDKTLGRADYVLYDRDGKPLAVVEVKKSALHPYRAKQQTLPYAQSIRAPFIFLTHGELIYFWDYTKDDAKILFGHSLLIFIGIR